MTLLLTETATPGREFSGQLKAMTGTPAEQPPIGMDERRLRDLLAAVVEQDQTAFSSLYEQLADSVYGLAWNITRNASLAEEVTEDAFWQIWRQAPRFDPARGSALAWIMTIARSRALDALRKQDNLADFGDLPEPAALTDTPADLLMAVEENSRVQAALAGLSPIPRQLVALAFLRGLSHDEIAGITGIPLGTVKSHIRRALLDLKQTLQTT